jgi:hypothetical protein
LELPGISRSEKIYLFLISRVWDLWAIAKMLKSSKIFHNINVVPPTRKKWFVGTSPQTIFRYFFGVPGVPGASLDPRR